jgi:hypothetical protein
MISMIRSTFDLIGLIKTTAPFAYKESLSLAVPVPPLLPSERCAAMYLSQG